ncbi:MAG: hypothetical protein ACRDOH_04370 [Streptosporangiaceae bacterium]
MRGSRFFCVDPDGGLAPERVITHRLPLAEAAEAYRLFDTRAATKVVLLP